MYLLNMTLSANTNGIEMRVANSSRLKLGMELHGMAILDGYTQTGKCPDCFDPKILEEVIEKMKYIFIKGNPPELSRLKQIERNSSSS